MNIGKQIHTLIPEHEFLICVDSDGSVMDTMNSKHMKCFGPCLEDFWALGDKRCVVLKRWNELNLFSATRGINRYRSLYILLNELNRNTHLVEGLDVFAEWVTNSRELSNEALKAEIDRRKREKDSNLVCMEKALEWSFEVNKKVEMLGVEDKKAFPGSQKGIEIAAQKADIAVVSSANPEALALEWKEQGFLPFIHVMMSQREGDKTDCIKILLNKGYRKEKVLMIGDAPGDFQAASENHVWFYPILAGKEEDSWNRFSDEILPVFIGGAFDEKLQKKLLENFKNNVNM